jgi:hypothetical protein
MDGEIKESNGILEECMKMKKAISHFYGEIARIRKGEERVYTFPITKETCMETISQCYDYLSLIEKYKDSYIETGEEENSFDFTIETDTASMFLTQIESYTHELEKQEKPSEIMTTENAVQVTSTSPNDTKGIGKKNKRAPKASIASEKEGLSSPPPLEERKEEEGVVKDVVNEKEVSKESLYQITDVKKEDENKKEEKVFSPQEKAIEAKIVKEEDIKPPPKEEEREELIVTQPEEDKVNVQVVLGEKDEGDDYEEGYISDNMPILTDEDINADGKSEDILGDIEIINDVEDDNDEAISTLPEDVSEHSVKTISRNKTNSFKAKLQKKVIDEKLVSSINLFPYNENDENIRKEYLLSRNNMIASPHTSRVSLLMSGYFVDISSYSNWDTISLERILRDSSKDFVDKEIDILNSIYDSILYFSNTQNKPSFNEWLQSVKFPDYDMLFFGLFDANYQGINYFKIECPYCGKDDIIIGKENKDLVVAVDRHYTDDMLIGNISAKETNKLDTSSFLPKWANSTRIKKITPNTKTIFIYKVPTLLDYVQMLSTVRRIAIRDKRPIDLSKILDPEDSMYSRLLLYLYINVVGMPSPVYSDPSNPKAVTSYKYIGLENKSDIIESINSLDIEDYAHLLMGSPVRDLLIKKSVYFFLKDIQCPNEKCGKTIKYINIDPRTIFFSRNMEAVRNLML